MRKIIWIILLCMSCANKNETKLNTDEVFENSKEINLEARVITLEELASQKLKEYFEVLQLQKKYVAFHDGEQKQISQFSKELLMEIDPLITTSIENIYQIKEVEKISDSVQKLQLEYSIITGGNKKTDSVYALITSKNIKIEGVTTRSIKIRFYNSK